MTVQARKLTGKADDSVKSEQLSATTEFMTAAGGKSETIEIMETYMPYLTLWDKISQNLAHLESNSHEILHILQNFQTILQHILWGIEHKSHFVVFITSFLHLNKGFWLFWGRSKVVFEKNLTEFYQISLKDLPYLTDFSPQLMACMWTQDQKTLKNNTTEVMRINFPSKLIFLQMRTTGIW